MRKSLTITLSALALGWLTGSVTADDNARPLNLDDAHFAIAQKGDASQTRHDAASPVPTSAAPLDCHGAPDCNGGGSLYADLGLLYLQPHWKSNPTFFSTVLVGGTTFNRQDDFNFNNHIGLRGDIGWMSDSGLGFRVRWMQFEETGVTSSITTDATATVTTANPLGTILPITAGASLSASAGLRVTVWDFEATQSLNAGHWSLLAAGGLRFARVSQDYDALAFSPGGDPIGAILSGHSFQGAGPSFALEVRRPMGCGGFTLYGSARASVLFGHTQETADQAPLGIGIPGVVPIEASASRDDVLPVLDLEIGAEYSRELGSARLVLQAGLVGQVWFGAGNSSNTDGQFPAIIGVPIGISGRNTDLGLFGAVLSAGVRF